MFNREILFCNAVRAFMISLQVMLNQQKNHTRRETERKKAHSPVSCVCLSFICGGGFSTQPQKEIRMKERERENENGQVFFFFRAFFSR